MRLAIAAREQPRIAGRQPSLPQGTRIYAVGDIHGRLDLLDKLLGRIEADQSQFVRWCDRSMFFSATISTAAGGPGKPSID